MAQLDTLIKEVALEAVREELIDLKSSIKQLPDLIAERMNKSYASDDILNTTQVAEYLKVSPQTITNWRNKGINLTYHMQNDKVRYLFADVEAFKDSTLGRKITPKR